MQGLADGYFVIPYTLANYLASVKPGPAKTDHPSFKAAEAQVHERTRRLLSIKGRRTVDEFHREMGLMMWEWCGMSRNEDGLNKLLDQLPNVREEFWRDVNVTGGDLELNQALERAGRVSDFLELAELLATDALHRRESCGGHFREESQTPEGEALRDDEHYAYVGAWEWAGEKDNTEPVSSGPLPTPILHKEPLEFEYVHLSQRSYK
jgi:succinate dehydrogenase / fumarate reductase flavoprotein subunit